MSTTSTARRATGENGRMGTSDPAASGRRRRAFTAKEKLTHLEAYEAACEVPGGGAAYLRQEGLYSSLITVWRKLRDGGALTGREKGEKVGKLTAEQAEIARLTAELARKNKKLA